MMSRITYSELQAAFHVRNTSAIAPRSSALKRAASCGLQERYSKATRVMNGTTPRTNGTCGARGARGRRDDM